ncbi:MAG: hypothetical protein K6E92_06585 [Lachnospiraceae bacterium]|nr:hypothetical protein [Lachnospiraceae bacterium]
MKNNLIKILAANPLMRVGDVTYNTEQITAVQEKLSSRRTEGGIGIPVATGRLVYAKRCIKLALA